MIRELGIEFDHHNTWRLVKEKEQVTSEGRLEAEVDVLLAVETNDEAGHIHHLGKRVKKLAQVDEVNT